MSMAPLAVLEATGEVAYISKHNGNYAQIEAVLNVLLGRTSIGGDGTTSPVTGFDIIFGAEAAFIGADSYAAEIDGGDATLLNVSAGAAYRFSAHLPASRLTGVILDFGAQAAGTYYITPSADGTPFFTLASTDALWSVAWNGTTTLSALTRVARTVWAAQDWIEAQASGLAGAPFLKLADRLDAMETAIGVAAGALADEFPPTTDGQMLVTDGADWQLVDRPILIRHFRPGLPNDGELVDVFIATQPLELPADLAGAFGGATVASLDDVEYSIKQGGIEIGTIEYATSDTPTFTLPGGLVMAAGDVIEFWSPATGADGPTNPYWSLVGKLLAP